MTDIVDTGIAKPRHPKHHFSHLVPKSAQRAFFSISEEQTAEAKAGLEAYMAADTPVGSGPLTASITTSRGKNGLVSVECRLEGAMDTPEFNRCESRILDALSTHPAFDKHEVSTHCEHHDGHVCLTANVIGISVQDYVGLLQSLAEHQHEQQTTENNNSGFYHEDAHHTHDAIVAAQRNLKSALVREMNNQCPPCDIKIDKCKSHKPGHYRMDIRIEGLIEANRGPVMSAFVRAMNRKRRGGMIVSSGHGEHVHQDFAMCDSQLTFDELNAHGFSHLLHKFAKPDFIDIVQNSNAATGMTMGGPN